MKNLHPFVAVSLALLLPVLLLSGCSSSGPKPVTLQAIQVNPAQAALTLGSNQAFTATGTYSDGTSKDLTTSVSWSSGDNSIAFLNNSPRRIGVANCRGVGNTKVTATLNSVNGFANLTVTALVPRFGYVTNNSDDTVSSYTVDAASGELRATGYVWAGVLNGGTPSGVAADPRGKFLYIGNNSGSVISAFGIDSDSGRLTPIPGASFPSGQFSNGIAIEPSGKFLYAADMSSTGQVSAYQIDASTGALSELPGSPFATGSISSFVTAEATGKFLYVTNQGSNDISAFTIDPGTGALSAISGSPFKAGNDPFEAVVDPSGKFLYVANVQSNNVSAYSIDAGSGVLTAVSGSPFSELGSQPTYQGNIYSS